MGKVIKCDFHRTERRDQMNVLNQAWNAFITGEVILTKEQQNQIQNLYSDLLFQENLWGACKYYK